MPITKSIYRTVLTLLVGISPFIDVRGIEPSRETNNINSDKAEQVEFFDAIENQSISVQFIPSDASKAKVIIKNVSDRPLDIVLPRSFAGVPVLAQLGNQPGLAGQNGFPGGFGNGQGLGLGTGQGFGNGLGQGFGNGSSQALGGGFPQGQVGGNQNGFPNIGGQGNFGRGLFRVDTNRIRKIDVQTVCLEYGRPDPNPRLPYRIVKLSDFTSNPRIDWICGRLAEGTISQGVAQAAAWNLANGLSWSNLAAIDRRNSRYTGREKFFSPQDLIAARRAVEYSAGGPSLASANYPDDTNSPSFNH